MSENRDAQNFFKLWFDCSQKCNLFLYFCFIKTKMETVRKIKIEEEYKKLKIIKLGVEI